MALKQKLKSERGNLNVGIKDMFMTIQPELFRFLVKMLAELRDTDKEQFNLVLNKFEEHKKNKPKDYCPENVLKMGLIRRYKDSNKLLSAILSTHWLCQDSYDGGYYWRLMPRKKWDESEAQFTARRKRMEDNLMQVMLDVLDDCNYYQHY